MYFKPRIFISSTFDLISIRNKINAIFVDSGAEVMLYEKNLTPSTRNATYRKDIQEADFVIFILNTRYGSKTKDSGLSGTHEEWRIASNYKIPCHVYINQNDDKEEELDKLIDDLKENNVSFYYYKDMNNLLKRMKETIFTIAQEIAVKKIDHIQFSEVETKKISFKFDYNRSLEFINLFEDLKRVSRFEEIDVFNTDIVVLILEYLSLVYNRNSIPFVDPKLNDLFIDLVTAYNDFSDLHTKLYTRRPTAHEIKVHLQATGETIKTSYLEYFGEPGERDRLRELLDNMMDKYNAFKGYIMNKKIYIDSI
jgi:hypothetical protein